MYKLVSLIIILIYSLAIKAQEISDKQELDSLYNVVQNGLISNPNNQYYLKAKGDIQLLRGLIKEAILSYDKSILINSDYEEARFARGVALYKNKNYDSALIDFNVCINFDSLNFDYYYHKALVYHDLGRFDNALLNYNKAIDLNNTNINPYLGKGILFMEHKDYNTAFDLFSQALTINPNNINILANRGYVLYQSGQYELSISDFNKCILIDSTMTISYKWIGLAYNKLNNMTKSCEYLNKAIDLNDSEINEILTKCK